MILVLLACVCSPDAPRLGGLLRAQEETAVSEDSGDTGGGASGTTVTTVSGTVTAIETLAPEDSADSSGEVVGVSQANGPWVHLALDTETGPADAWYLAGAPDLVEVGETVRIEVGAGADDVRVNGFTLWVGEERRLWVARVQARYATVGDTSALIEGPDGLSFAHGDEACREKGGCQQVAHHDLVVTSAEGTVDLPYGGSVVVGDDTVVHGGEAQYIGVSTAFACGEPWVMDEVTVAVVANDRFDEGALWP